LQELRGEISDEEKKEESDEGEVDEDGQPVKPKKLSEHEEFEEKLTENAEDCARHHFRLLQVTKKEYKILQKQFDSLKEKSDILRN
jgi:cobalamin biosynthesis protein CobT